LLLARPNLFAKSGLLAGRVCVPEFTMRLRRRVPVGITLDIHIVN